MNYGLLETGKDPMGNAIYDYFCKGQAGRLRVFSPQFDEDEIPVETLFREYDEMPELERMALDMARGKILDVGAGSGCHSVALLDMNKDVEAVAVVDLIKGISPIIKEVRVFDVFEDASLGDKRSLALGVIFQDPNCTLEDGVVDELADKIVSGVKQDFDGELRA